MNRRSYLGALGVTGATGLAGCLGDGLGSPLSFGDSDTALDPPDEPRGNPSHPIHGEEFPTFSLPDPLAETEVSLEEFEDDRAYLMTFIYTSCTESCAALVQLLGLVQEDAAERGYEDDVAFLAVTFDPETDGPEELREYGETYGADLEAGNWHFLRPETTEEALTLLNDRLGVPADLDDDHHDHDGDEETGNEDNDGDSDADDGDDDADDGYEDHDEDDSDDVDGSEDDNDDHDRGAPGVHYYTAFLVNERGIVERSYPNVTDSRAETRPQSIIEDVRTVVE